METWWKSWISFWSDFMVSVFGRLLHSLRHRAPSSETSESSDDGNASDMDDQQYLKPSAITNSSSLSSLNEPPLSVTQSGTGLHTPNGTLKTPFLIGVAGGGSSGKKTVCEMIMRALLEQDERAGVKVVIIRMEDFYRQPAEEEMESVKSGEYNFDHPSSVDFRLMERCLEDILNGRPTEVPQYDFKRHIRLPETVHIERPDVVIFSGIYMLYKKRVREALNLKVFVDVDSDTRLARQVVRDTEERYNKELESVLQYYIKYVKPSFEDFILPSKKFADVIIPRGHENTVAINLLTQHISDILRERAHEARQAVVEAGLDVRTLSTTLAAQVVENEKFGSLPQ
ncbi:uridine kinase family-domain-containing protein [Phlyctochytrium arcticum]|nr:uridine kinase family-domain-containing protein [Phlyctochytrium arcticum]